MPTNYGAPRKTLRLMPAALLLSIAGLSLARPVAAAEVRYDPGDKVYFTYCHSHPPAMRIKSGDSVITTNARRLQRRILRLRQDRLGKA